MKIIFSKDFEKMYEQIPENIKSVFINWISGIYKMNNTKQLKYKEILGFPHIKYVDFKDYKLGFRIVEETIFIDGILKENVLPLYF